MTRITPEIKADLKEFADRVLPYFKKYDIPHLNCEILGYHLKNLSSFIYRLSRLRTNQLKRTYFRTARIRGTMPPSIKLTMAQELIEIDIEGVITDEFNRLRFRRFNYDLDRIFDDYFYKIRVCLRCVGMSKPYTVGDYLKKVIRYRRKDENFFFTSECIEEMRKELGKYLHFRQGSRRIDDIFLAIEKTFADYEM